MHCLYHFGNFYASKTFDDPTKQHRILWGWANKSDSWIVDDAKGWANMHSSKNDVI